MPLAKCVVLPTAAQTKATDKKPKKVSDYEQLFSRLS